MGTRLDISRFNLYDPGGFVAKSAIKPQPVGFGYYGKPYIEYVSLDIRPYAGASFSQ